MIKIPAIQTDIVTHLRSAGRPETSRALAARFLRIQHGDEETCRRLLAPFLAAVPGIVHRAEEGWSLAKTAPGASDTTAREIDTAPEGFENGRGISQSLRDFVALASEGTGPGGSGVPAAVSLLPVVAGEECQEEHFPGWDLDDEDARPPDAGSGSGLSPSALQELVQTVGDLPVVCHRVAREVEPLRRLCAQAGIPFQTPVISVAKLGHLLLGLKSNHAAADLAQALGMDSRGPDDCRGRARIVAESFLRLVPQLQERGIDTLDPRLNRQFDVHERPAPYGPRLNLVVVLRDAGLPAPGVTTCTLHLLRGGRYVRRLGGLASDAEAPGGAWETVRSLIARLYFPSSTEDGRAAGGGEPVTAGRPDEGVDIDWELVSSFVRKYRDEINVLDVDECASPAEAVGVVRSEDRGRSIAHLEEIDLRLDGVAVRREAAPVGDEQEFGPRRRAQQDVRRLTVGAVVVMGDLRVLRPDDKVAIAVQASDQDKSGDGGRGGQTHAGDPSQEHVRGFEADPTQKRHSRQDPAGPQSVRHPFDRQDVRQEHGDQPPEEERREGRVAALITARAGRRARRSPVRELRHRRPGRPWPYDEENAGEEQETRQRIEHGRAAQVVAAVAVSPHVEHQEGRFQVSHEIGRHVASFDLRAEDGEDPPREGEVLRVVQVVQEHRHRHDERRRGEHAEPSERYPPALAR